MATVDAQIHNAAQVICANIVRHQDDRGLLSQNLLAHTRNLIEAIAVRLHARDGNTEFEYAKTHDALAFVGSSNKRVNFLHRFHSLVQISASHYTMDGDASERLMLKYFSYMVRVRTLLREECGIEALADLEKFPIDRDPALRDYHEKIAAQIDAARGRPLSERPASRYYVHRTRPFFVQGRVFYEVTFYPATNKATKFDRVIAFTDQDLSDKYSARLWLEPASIDVLGQTMPITLITDWEISIRPCEFDALARLFGLTTEVRSGSREYRFIADGLTSGTGSLLELMDMPDAQYARVRAEGVANIRKPQIFPTLDAARDLMKRNGPGCNVIRYLMLRMRNEFLKAQYSVDRCDRLSRLHLAYGCIPFDQMPFCTSLIAHNPRYWDLAESLEVTGRTHELLARRVKNNVENRGVLYTPVSEVEDLGDVDQLIETYNGALYYKHRARRGLTHDKRHVFMNGYEDDTVTIIETLQASGSSGIDGYSAAVEQWLSETPRGIDDDVKRQALVDLLSESRVALVYGAAGTGKSTMVNHIANYFNDKRKLFLAHTNPAIDNLKRRVSAQDSTFRTIASHKYRTRPEPKYDLLVIDECSTVSNADLIKVLEKTSFELVVLVGDVYQIEAIQFGNWFNVIRHFIPQSSIFELRTPFRTNSKALLDFWDKVRALGPDIAETMAHHKLSTKLDESLFTRHDKDEIILCLNYDGLYGINNINRFMQSSNPGDAVTWGAASYKVGDPILFNDTERFGRVIYNNLKATIVGIERFADRVQFDVKLERTISQFDVQDGDLEWLGDSTVRFSVYDRDTSDEDDDSLETSVPFQVAYAVSIHKAQGLEYKSVKVVVTQANEDDISHSVFYTAVTRARERLQVLWSPETEHAVLSRLEGRDNKKEVALLAKRRGLQPV